jgi:hypothetical protein
MCVSLGGQYIQQEACHILGLLRAKVVIHSLQTCMHTCVSYEEEDTCDSFPADVMHTYAHRPRCVCARTPVSERAHARMQLSRSAIPCMCVNTHTYTHTHIHAHTYTHIQGRSSNCCRIPWYACMCVCVCARALEKAQTHGRASAAALPRAPAPAHACVSSPTDVNQ